MPRVTVHRTYLELPAPESLRPPERAAPPGATWQRIACDPEGYRTLYRDVGSRWHWRDRLAWTETHLRAHLARPEISVWTMRLGGEDAGFVELERHADGAMEIVYFGLKERFIGRGLGGAMLASAVQSAFEAGATRVWLHTCSLDSPAALPNYLARGFRRFREEDYETDLPDAAVATGDAA